MTSKHFVSSQKLVQSSQQNSFNNENDDDTLPLELFSPLNNQAAPGALRDSFSPAFAVRTEAKQDVDTRFTEGSLSP